MAAGNAGSVTEEARGSLDDMPADRSIPGSSERDTGIE
jgi:hypothetical protein